MKKLIATTALIFTFGSAVSLSQEATLWMMISNWEGLPTKHKFITWSDCEAYRKDSIAIMKEQKPDYSAQCVDEDSWKATQDVRLNIEQAKKKDEAR